MNFRRVFWCSFYNDKLGILITEKTDFHKQTAEED